MALDEAAFDRAVDTARQAIPVMKEVTREDCWVGYTIVRGPERYAVYSANAWERPATPGFLPWSPPTGEPVADVALDGTVTMRGVEQDDGLRECSRCGDRVGYLSSQDWCDGCEEEVTREPLG